VQGKKQGQNSSFLLFMHYIASLLSCLLKLIFFIMIKYSLDYPGVGPEHSFLKERGRAEYHSATDEEALEGMGITP
jgi:hypothetical protein